MSHAEAYKDEGTPAEQSRRTFMVRATVALGGVIAWESQSRSLRRSFPRAMHCPQKWSPLTPQEFARLQKTTQKPVKVSFAVKDQDGHLPRSFKRRVCLGHWNR